MTMKFWDWWDEQVRNGVTSVTVPDHGPRGAKTVDLSTIEAGCWVLYKGEFVFLV